MGKVAALGMSLLLVTVLLLPGCERGRSGGPPSPGSNQYGATSKLSLYTPLKTQYSHSKDTKGGLVQPDIAEGVGQPDLSETLTFLDL